MTESAAEKAIKPDQNPDDLPTTPAQLMAELDRLGISYELHKHDPVFTVSESAYLKAHIPGIHCRNLFLRDKKKKMYLVVAANETAVDLKKLQHVIGSDRLSFGSAERLWENLGVWPGSVCPFAIINDTKGTVRIVLDKTMMDGDLVNYHPMINSMTVCLIPDDLKKFIKATGHEPEVIDLRPAAPDAD